MDPTQFPAGLVRRRQRVIEIIERLHAEYPQVYGDRRRGGSPE
ncbi:MAG: hypothetical protein ACYS99_17925 [Planctomycetota bacterium]